MYLQPIPVVKTYGSFPNINILCILYCNFIFDLTYLRVKYKKKIYKLFRLKPLLEAIILSYFGLNKLIIKLIKAIIISRHFVDIADYIYIYYNNLGDTRKLFYYNNNWEANPDPIKALRLIIDSQTQLSSSQLYKISNIIDNTVKLIKKSPKYSLVKTQKFKHKDETIVAEHEAVLESYDSETNRIGLQTDFKKAEIYNFYNKNLAIIKF